jgi:hypothetical protein
MNTSPAAVNLRESGPHAASYITGASPPRELTVLRA